MNFELSLTIVLVFLVPGSVVLLALVLASPYASILVTSILNQPSTPSVILLLAACFLLGAILDSLRTALLDRGITWLVGPPPSGLLRHVTAENLPVFTMLLERTQGYYRLNSNLLLGLLILFGIELLIIGFNWVTLILIVLIAAIAVRSVRARRETFSAMRQFVATNARN